MQVVPVQLTALGETPPAVPPVSTGERVVDVDGYRIELACRDELRPLEMQRLAFRVTRDGELVTDPQPFLGTLGHLVMISADRERFLHSHPLPPVLADGQVPDRGPDVVFSAQFPAPGLYKAWGQFQHRGHVITAPFVLDVLPRR
jgi:hypothetical protein